MKIQLPELDVISCNGSWTGLILKKHLTFDEARFIAASALGVNMDLLLDDWWARSIDEEDDIKDEIADVMIMCEQLSYYFGKEKVELEKERKLERLKERLSKYTD